MAKFKGSKSKYDISPVKPREKCICCNGSGRYDHNGSPKCKNCNGTGYEIKAEKKGNL